MRSVNVLPPDLNLLQVLSVLLEQRHVSRTAEQLGMSQPAVSRALARLRKDFSDPLLVRSGNRLVPTPRALELMRPLREALDSAAQLYRPMATDPATAAWRFRAAIPDAVAATILPRLVERVSKASPASTVELIPWPQPGHGSIETLDFAISTETSMFPRFRAEWLYDDVDVLALASPNPPTGLGEMLAMPHVAVIATGSVSDPVDRWLASLGLSRRIAAVVPHYLQALQVVAGSSMAAILPRRLVAAAGSAIGVSASSLPLEQSPDRLYLFYPPERSSDPGWQWLKAMIRQVIKKA